MYLRELDEKTKFAEFVRMIKETGGSRKFFADICLASVENRPGVYKCPVSKKDIKKRKAYMLTNSAGIPILNDRFASDSNAEIALRCIKALYLRYQQYLGPKNQEEISEDELRDNFPMNENEGTKSYLARLRKHLEELENVTPKISEEERPEDHL